ncbi:hypothetical protein MMC25_002003 [Agyrium rufum]|nr:hypothetical protein [Agyrium rufum]
MARTYATPAAVIVISVLFPVLGIIAVSLRFHARSKLKTRFGIDDWLTIPALLFECALAGLLIWGAVTQSLGDLLPKPNVPGPQGYLLSDSAQQIRMQQISYYFNFTGVFTFGLLKLSLLFFYRRVFRTRVGKTTIDYATTALIVLVIVWTLAFGVGAIFYCGTRPAYAWSTVAVVAKKCSAKLQLLEAYAISDFIMDVIICFLPIPTIWALNMTTRRKLAVTAVFLVGLLTIAASAARMAIYIIYIVNAYAHADGETLITYLLFWTMVESGLGVIVVCLPTLRSLYGTTFSPGSILSGIRSAFSLWSVHSHSSSEPGVHRLHSLDKTAKSSTSYSDLHGSHGNAPPDFTDLESQIELPKGAG